MNEYIYLFQCCDDNGYGNSYTNTFFSSNEELNQSKVDECIKLAEPLAGRIGSNYSDFEKGAKENGIKIGQLSSQPQPKIQAIFRNITGNY